MGRPPQVKITHIINMEREDRVLCRVGKSYKSGTNKSPLLKHLPESNGETIPYLKLDEQRVDTRTKRLISTVTGAA